ncbi:hypothetical protein COU60_03960 [Candidatus Pacearchaeota archaeon CG10_big_fil_rev_8_21_14_0_10_34_76]|nr:MAG: hypothetical protein COU60_03960 [Candidatus Pacearchaeota archaeon CG10_big_fil_rev_8_21_14_0_10_34_76]
MTEESEKYPRKFRIINGLEGVMGEKATGVLTNNSVYKFGVDGIAMNLFSLIYILNERYAAGLDWSEAWATRGAAAIGNSLTGRPYGIYNDWVRNLVGATEKGKVVRKYCADVAAFATGQTPLYALYLMGGSMLEGAIESVRDLDLTPTIESFRQIDWGKLKDAAAFLTFVAPLLGTPQKMTYDLVRGQFGVNEKPGEIK